VRAEIKELLLSDEALAGILTGGVHATGEITRQNAPEAFDETGQIKPCCLVTLSTRAKHVSGIPGAADQFITIYFYQQAGYEAIDAAMARTYALLNGSEVTIEDGYCYEIEWADDLGDSEDPAIGCSMRYSRYRAVVKR